MTPAGPPDDPGPEAFASFDPRYVVERELGRGAMGRVFLARDLRLDRLVAIKALAPGLHDAIDLRRLEHEARAAGSLNHPNIVAVHDIGTSDGRPFIVSEYLRGETLRQMLEAGPLPWAQALEFGLQLARGLAAAHERGIVHRDLKPENLFVTEDGWLKILDFGIAKRAAQTGPEADTPQRLTPPQLEALHSALPPMTSPGEILGTVGYMSPEQVLGQPADARSDIFAFGTILYEMLTGARAFHRERAAATSFAILRDEPPPLPEAVPARLREAVAHCLRKDPAQRFASARDLAAALDEMRPTGDMPTVGRASGSRPWLIAVAALSLALAGAGVFTAWKVAHRAPPSFRQLTFHPGAVWSARFGPDGKQVFYGAAWDAKLPRIFVTVPGNPEPVKVQVDDGQLLAVSPTGELAMLARPASKQVGFDQGTLTVGRPGTGPFAEVSPEVEGADFAPDGSLALIRQKEHRSILELPPGHEIAASSGWFSNPRVSRDGRLVAFIEHPNTFDDGGSVEVSDRTGNTRVLSRSFRSALGLAWSPRGDEIWFTAAAGETGSKSALRAIDLRGNERVLTQVGGDLKLEDVSSTGAVLVTLPERRLGVALRRASSQHGIDLSWFDRANLVDLAADGSGVLLTVAGAAGGESYSIYYRAADGSPARRLGAGLAGALSPDGSLALALSGSPDVSLSLLPVKSSGPPRALAARGIAVGRARFFPDGHQLLLIGSQAGRRTQLYKLGIDDIKDPVPISGEGAYAATAVISPDGKGVATVAEDLRTVIYPSTGGPPRALPQLKPGEWPFGWGVDQTLYVGRVHALPVSIDRLDLRSGQRTPWLMLFPEAPGATHITRVLVNTDASVVAYNYASLTTHLYMLQGLN